MNSGIEELSGDTTDKSRTFIFSEESHTLGNCLVSIITNYPEVVFCGYTVPHPAERKLHVRIQTNGPRAIDILKRGLKELEKLCDETTVIFKKAMAEYRKQVIEHPLEIKMATYDVHQRVKLIGFSYSSERSIIDTQRKYR